MSISPDNASVWLSASAKIEVSRRESRVTFILAEVPTPELIAHPLLSVPAAIVNRWRGRPSLHGGAFLHEDGAWGVLGPRAAGKSTLLGQLLAEDVPVISDDVLVIDGASVYAGPRSIDLREESARVLGGDEMGILGGRTRWRLAPAPTPAQVPLNGLVELRWGSEVRLDPLALRERLALLRDSVIYPSADAPEQLLDLLELPAWRLTRPRDLSASADVLGRLMAQLQP